MLILLKRQSALLYLNPREIERQTGISRSSVQRKKDLALNQHKHAVGLQLNANWKVKRLKDFPTDRRRQMQFRN